jgi:hypothetical protein
MRCPNPVPLGYVAGCKLAAITRWRTRIAAVALPAQAWRAMPMNTKHCWTVAGLHSAHDLAARQAACLAQGWPPKLRRWDFQKVTKVSKYCLYQWRLLSAATIHFLPFHIQDIRSPTQSTKLGKWSMAVSTMWLSPRKMVESIERLISAFS